MTDIDGYRVHTFTSSGNFVVEANSLELSILWSLVVAQGDMVDTQAVVAPVVLLRIYYPRLYR